MRGTLVIFMLLAGSAWSASTESVRAVADALDRLGPQGPAILLREYTGRLDAASSTSWTFEDRYVALANMADFCTSPPRRPLMMERYDWGQLLDTLSRREIDLVIGICKRINTTVRQRLIEEANAWEAREKPLLSGASGGAPATIERKLRWRLYE